jgi:hypothetical protein
MNHHMAHNMAPVRNNVPAFAAGRPAAPSSFRRISFQQLMQQPQPQPQLPVIPQAQGQQKANQPHPKTENKKNQSNSADRNSSGSPGHKQHANRNNKPPAGGKR